MNRAVERVEYTAAEKDLLRRAFPRIPVDRAKLDATLGLARAKIERRRRAKERWLIVLRVVIALAFAVAVTLLVMVAINIGRWLVGR